MAESDRVLAVQFALKVHIGEGNRQLFLDGDQVDVKVLGSKSSLQLNPCGIRRSLDILVDSFLHIVHVTLVRSDPQLSPGMFSRNFLDIRPLDLAVVLAILEGFKVRNYDPK